MIEIAQTAERGLLDMVFCADTHSVFTAHEQGLHRLHYVAWIEPFTMLAALASHTKNIGLVCTASTSFEQPYIGGAQVRLARPRERRPRRLERGHLRQRDRGAEFQQRAAQAEGRALPARQGIRRGRAGAVGLAGTRTHSCATRKTCLFFDPEKMHTLNHHGEFFDVRGPLNVPRSPQGQPVLVQAGASDDGRELAAQTAEVVFTAHPGIERAKAFYADLKGRMARYGRNPDHLKILPGLSITVGRTHARSRGEAGAAATRCCIPTSASRCCRPAWAMT